MRNLDASISTAVNWVRCVKRWAPVLVKQHDRPTQRPDLHWGGQAPMARLRFLYVIHTTAEVADADTDGNFELVVFSPVNPQAEIGEFGFPDLPHDERERGRTDQYRLNVSSLNLDMFQVRPEILAIRTGSDDAWLPSSIWVIAEDVQGNRQLEVALPNWPSSLWWSTQESEGERIRRLVVPLTQ